MSEVDDIFAAAKAAKTDGMRRAEENADMDWSDLMLELTKQVCEDREFFTSDDVFDKYDELTGAPSTHDARAYGPVMRRAATLGYCTKADVAPVPSRRKSLHMSPRSVWRSCLYRSKK